MSRAGSLARAFGSDGALNIADIGNVAATAVPYSNAVSGISANTVQEAIDYLNTLSSGGAGDVASYTRQKFTATAGQTTFTVTAGYTVGYLQVFMNGILLDVSDYAASDGSTVVLSAAAAANDEIVTIALDSFNIAELLRVTNISASAPNDSVVLDSVGVLSSNGKRIKGVGAVLSFDTTNGENANYIKTVNDYQMELACGRGVTSKVRLTNGNGIYLTGSETAVDAVNVTTAGNLAFAAGKGIDFSANSNASGATSEVLDDYEVGTWTPSVYGISGLSGVTAGEHTYTKIGKSVSVAGSILYTGSYVGVVSVVVNVPFNHRVASGSAICGTCTAYPNDGNRQAGTVIDNTSSDAYGTWIGCYSSGTGSGRIMWSVTYMSE